MSSRLNTILVVVDDLIFLSKIQHAAALLNVPLETASPGGLRAKMVANVPGAVILDLNHRSGQAIDALRAVKEDADTRDVMVVGFVSHVQADLIDAARKAGCDVVLARSAFSQRLPEILQGLATPKT